MKGARDEFFACAALTIDQHSRVGGCHLFQQLTDADGSGACAQKTGAGERVSHFDVRTLFLWQVLATAEVAHGGPDLSARAGAASHANLTEILDAIHGANLVKLMFS